MSGGYDRRIALWDIESQSQSPIREFKVHKKEVEVDSVQFILYSMKFLFLKDISWHATNPNLFVSCSDDCTMALIDKRGETAA